MSRKNSDRSDKSHDSLASWERPVLRRLAADEARGGINPGNDGKGGGSGSEMQHS
jgi:hypothetical protein